MAITDIIPRSMHPIADDDPGWHKFMMPPTLGGAPEFPIGAPRAILPGTPDPF